MELNNEEPQMLQGALELIPSPNHKKNGIK